MIRLNDQVVNDESYRQEPKEDLIRIQKALFIQREIFFTLDECGNIWQNYSWNLHASWLDIPTSLEKIISFIESDSYFKSYEDSSTIE